MTRPERITMEVPATVASGAPIRVERFASKTIQFAGVTGAMNIEGSMDGLNWSTIGAAVNASGLRSLTETILFLRISRTSNGAGSAVFAGLDQRAQ